MPCTVLCTYQASSSVFYNPVMYTVFGTHAPLSTTPCVLSLTLQERLLGVRDSSADQHDVPLQLRLEVKVFNRDPQGSAPMEFQVRECAN